MGVFSGFGTSWEMVCHGGVLNQHQICWECQNDPKWSFLSFLAQKASKVIISLFSGFWDSSMKMRGSFLSKGGTQSWPGTAIVNHPLRLKTHPGLSYFPYIFYFVNFTISAARGQGLFGTFENVIKDFGILGQGANFPTFLGVILPCFGDDF